MSETFVRSRQETGSYCGPAVMQMLLSAYGLSVSQESVVEASGAKKYVMKEGITLNALAKGVEKLSPEIKIWKKENSEIADIAALIDMSYLVGVDWQGIFNSDEYGDDEEYGWWRRFNDRKSGLVLKGTQGHYCIVLEVDLERGFVKFADPYGHYAGRNRFTAIWEFSERWWDDRIDKDEKGRSIYVLEERMLFVLARENDGNLSRMGLVTI